MGSEMCIRDSFIVVEWTQYYQCEKNGSVGKIVWGDREEKIVDADRNTMIGSMVQIGAKLGPFSVFAGDDVSVGHGQEIDESEHQGPQPEGKESCVTESRSWVILAHDKSVIKAKMKITGFMQDNPELNIDARARVADSETVVATATCCCLEEDGGTE